MLGDPAAHGAAPAVVTADLINGVDGRAAGVVADDAAVVMTVVTGAGFGRSDEPDSGGNSKQGDKLFHKGVNGVFSGF